PPGAPLFVLLGRFFIILFGDDGSTAAKAVNVMNALASGFTVLFLFWTITHFARKLMTGFREEPVLAQTITIMGAGLVGGLAYTFTDSFWYSAVEGEVYALASFFTALAFWAILKWERADEAAGNDAVLRNRADRWIVFIFFTMGLSIGVHLLGLLTIPAIVMAYYFRRYTYSRKGAIWAFIIGCIITGIVQVVVIQWTVKFAGKFDVFFVNDFNLPFFSGFIFFYLLLAVLIWLGLRWANKNNWSFLKLGLWCMTFMLIGYSTYITTLERSNANPSIDMNNVDNPMNLVYYLGREQYGSQPILYGPHYQAEIERDEFGQPVMKTGAMRYSKSHDSYVPIGRKQEYSYNKDDMQLFPRVWDGTNEQGHAEFYADWLGLKGYDMQSGQEYYEPPTYADNIRWFFTYQLGFMYWRYFMWNYSGRQNDIQGGGNRRDGNWISGISFMDNLRLGDQAKMPESIRDNKANNKLFLLPFLLGIIGVVYQFFRDRKDFIVTFLLFFFTGIAIVLYLNQPGNQPRERDYAYSGSFYAFAIWIGLAVVAFARMAREAADKKTLSNVILYGGLTTVLILLMSDANAMNGNTIIAALLGGAIYALLTGGVTFLVRAVAKDNLRTGGIIATGLCMIAPVIMAAQEWNDHDRSKKYLAPDLARNYLNSCPPNAILFTFGDNDTYPLWYAQEVENVRPDIRIVNTSLLGIDWYVNQLRYRVNQSDPIDVIWTEDQIIGLQAIALGKDPGVKNLYDVMKNQVGPMLNNKDKSELQAIIPYRNYVVPVDTNAVRRDTTLAGDSIGTEIQINLSPGRNYLTLDQMTMLNILAANGFKRPICFTSNYGVSDIGFSPYLRQEGMIYRLVPVRHAGDPNREPNIEAQKSYDLLMNEFRPGSANVPGVYFDEENRRHLLSMRMTYALTAGTLADQGRKQEAVNLLSKAESLIAPQQLPYAMVSRFGNHNQTAMLYLHAAYRAGHADLAKKVSAALKKDINEQISYFNYLKSERPDYFAFERDEQIGQQYLKIMAEWEKQYGAPGAVIPESPQRNDTLKDTGR
ncbi:MAG TPA: DUF2723 domain-containing protein, partial [Flavisolibacter sp.]